MLTFLEAFLHLKICQCLYNLKNQSILLFDMLILYLLYIVCRHFSTSLGEV